MRASSVRSIVYCLFSVSFGARLPREDSVPKLTHHHITKAVFPV